MKKFTFIFALIVAFGLQSIGQGVFISQNCDPKNNWGVDRFAEIYNPTDAAGDLTGWTLENIQGGAVLFTWTLSGSIASGEALVCGNADATGRTITPDFTAVWAGNSWNGKGGDGTILKNASGTEIDVAVQADATGKFENKQMLRNADITSPTTTYDAAQWTFNVMNDAVDANPGNHICDLPIVATCDVTFKVDMQNQVVSGDGVHLAISPGWATDVNTMTDADLDEVYEVTLTLDKSTDYEFKYINGDSWDAPDVPETVPAACATGGNRTISVGTEATLALDVVCFGECVACNTLDWYNLQSPENASIFTTDDETIYAQAYEDGVTNVLGNEDEIECWIGYSTTDSDPSTWTDWVAATYNTQSGNNYEYMANLGATQPLAAGTFYYASRFSLNSGDYTYGGYNGGAWDGVTNVSGVLTVTALATIPYTQTFETSIGDWIEYSVASNRNWYHDDNYMKINGFGGDVASDDYLISPIFNLDNYTNEYISFDSYTKYADAILGLEFLYTTNYTGDPATTTWESLAPMLPEPDSQEWFVSGNVDISAIVGTTVRFAFHYETTGTGGGTTSDWRVDNIIIGLTATWTGAIDNSWIDAGNWDTDVYPDGANWNVVIPEGCANYPTLEQGLMVNNIDIAEGATFIGTSHLMMEGTITTKRHVQWYDQYHYLTSPVGTIAIEDAFPNGSVGAAFYMYSYDEPTQMWDAMAREDDMEAGAGYNIYRDAGASLDFDITFSTTEMVAEGYNYMNLSYTAAAGNEDYESWHLLGNPCVAAFDWDLKNGISGMQDAVYTWDGVAENYVSWTAGAGALTDGIVPLGQGYMVKVTSGTNSLNTNGGLVHSSTGMYKSSANALRLNVTSTENNYQDATFVRVVDGNEADYSADKLFGSEKAPQLYTVENEEEYSINAINNELEAVALNFRAGEATTYTITAAELLNNATVTLEDLQTGTTQVLNENATYTFEATTGDDAERFVIHLKAGNAVNELDETAYSIYAFNNTLYVDAAEAGLVNVYNTVGQVVNSTNATTGLNSINLESGIYIVNINGVSQKVIVK